MASLTNTPALDLAQVAASADLASFSIDTSEEDASMKKILAALGLAETAGEDAALSAINKLLTGSTALATAAGLAADAEPTAVIAAFKAQGGSAEPDPTKYVPLAAVTDLQNQVRSLQQERSADKAEATVSLAVEQGKLAPALREWGRALAKKDLAQFEAFTAGAPVLTAQQTKPAPERKAGDAPALDAEQREAARALGVDVKTYAATLAAEAAEQETL